MSEVLTQKFVTTRKPHKCCGCGQVLPARTRMEYQVVADGGKLQGSYWCAVCVRYWDDNMASDDLIDEGDLLRNDPEGWEQASNKVNKVRCRNEN